MKRITLIKWLIVLVIIFLFLFYVVNSFKQNAQVCANYYHQSCTWYFPSNQECLCSGERLFLNESMIKERNDIIFLQNQLFNSVGEEEYPNWSEILV